VYLSKDSKIANEFNQTIREIYLGEVEDPTLSYYYQRTSNAAFSPDAFLEKFLELAPQFGGRRQHDAQEFLRVLVDKLSDDLKETPRCLQNTEPDASERELEEMTLEARASYWWKRHLAENSSFITDQFCGQVRKSHQFFV